MDQKHADHMVEVDVSSGMARQRKGQKSELPAMLGGVLVAR